MKTSLLLCLLFALVSPAHAASFIVNVGGAQQVFTPQTLTIQVGDAVTFVNKGGFHNALSDDNGKLFRCARGCDATGGNGNASSSNWVATVTFTKAGQIGYYCEIHGMPGAGMYGTINVQGPIQPPPAKLPVPGGDATLYGLLAAALALMAGLRLRRRD